MDKDLLQSLPSVDFLLNVPQIISLANQHGRDVVLHTVRSTLDQTRKELVAGAISDPVSKEQMPFWMVARIEKTIARKFAPSLRKAINATGVILHTGLGRGLMPDVAVDQIEDVSRGFCNLAIDIDSGKRGNRDTHISSLLRELTGAEAATIACNNAAATMVILHALAKGKEVIVSRGQLVEIGGSFRIPEVMEASGATLRDVGTTNKTHLRDYAAAINENTAAIMHIHHSNYRIMGFTSEPSVKELADLAHQHGIFMIDDIGSGAMVDLAQFGLESEPLVRDSIADGADVVCFSGDKLIGGPQAGLIIGKAGPMKKIAKNPLARACRVGKLTIAGLEATLKLFLRPDTLTTTHPLYAMFAATPDMLSKRAKRMRKAILPTCAEGTLVEVAKGESQVGSGAVPVETIPSIVLRVESKTMTPEHLARKLRQSVPAIVGRVHKEALLLDLRTVAPSEDAVLQATLCALLKA